MAAAAVTKTKQTNETPKCFVPSFVSSNEPHINNINVACHCQPWPKSKNNSNGHRTHKHTYIDEHLCTSTTRTAQSGAYTDTNSYTGQHTQSNNKMKNGMLERRPRHTGARLIYLCVCNLLSIRWAFI